MLYGKTQEQLIEREWVSDVVSKPSESRGQPETSVEASRVEKKAVVYHRALQGKVRAIHRASGLVAPLVLHLASPAGELNLSNAKAYVWV